MLMHLLFLFFFVLIFAVNFWCNTYTILSPIINKGLYMVILMFIICIYVCLLRMFFFQSVFHIGNNSLGELMHSVCMTDEEKSPQV